MPEAPSENPREKILLDVQETAAVLSVNRSHVYALHHAGRIPRPIKLGRRTLWSRAELDSWVAAVRHADKHGKQ